MKKSLIEQAKSVEVRGNVKVDDDYLELSVSWLKGELRNSQVAKVINKPISTVPYHMALALQEAYKVGKIKSKHL